LQQAQTLFTQAAQTAKRLAGENSVPYSQAYQQLLTLAGELGRPGVVESLSPPPSMAVDREEVWRTRYEAAMRTIERGEYPAAAGQLQEIAPAMQRLYGTRNTDGIFPYTALSMALFHSGMQAASDAAITAAFEWSKQLPELATRHHIAVPMARQLLRSNRIAAAGPLITDAAAYFEALPDGQRFAARVHLLEGELLLRRRQFMQAGTLLQHTYDSQQQIFGGFHREMCLTLTLQALASDLATGVGTALPLYQRARDMIHTHYVDGHPDRVKAQLFLDYATWRKEQSMAAESALRRTWQAYKQALAMRADLASLDVLSNEMLSKTSATQIQDHLFALLNY
jgi:hypothetical protein